MAQYFHSAKPIDSVDRDRTRARLSEHFKRRDGPWRSEAMLEFRAFHTVNGDRIYPPNPESVRYAERLMAGLEQAAAHVRCGLCGMWRSGVHFIPGSGLVHTIMPVAFRLLDGNGGFSPVVVGPKEILLQAGEKPFVFNYNIETDLRPHFQHAIIPASFF